MVWKSEVALVVSYQDGTLVPAIEQFGNMISCPYCGKKHMHGAMPGASHRVAHCADGGSLEGAAKNGYFLLSTTVDVDYLEQLRAACGDGIITELLSQQR